MEGYNRLAGYIGSQPELAIFRRYLPLNARNILCMQAEILRLQDSLHVIIEKDRNSGDARRKQYEYNIGLLKGPHENHIDGLQWKKTLELRQLLREYSTTFSK